MFKLNSKGIGLTYSNVAQQLERREEGEDGPVSYYDSMKRFFLLKLRALDPEPIRVIVSEENHQDGSKHYHCFCQWLGESRVDHTFFDFCGMHPNIQQLTKHRQAWINYIKKEDFTPEEWVKVIDLDSDYDEGILQ